MKFKASYGSSALPSIVAQIEQELAIVLGDLHREMLRRLSRFRARCKIHSLDILAPYLDTVENWWIGRSCAARTLRFVVDPDARRGSRTCSPRSDARNGIACDEIRGTRDPLFGGVNPEPIEPHVAALREAVRDGQVQRRLRRRRRRRPHRRRGPRRHVHHAAPDFLHPVLASGRNAPIAGEVAKNIFHHQAAR